MGENRIGMENRSWRTNRRGRVLVHAGLRDDRAATEMLTDGYSPATGEPIAPAVQSLFVQARKAGHVFHGGIVGTVEITGCVSRSASPWFVGEYGFILERGQPLPFHPVKGALGFFSANYPGL